MPEHPPIMTRLANRDTSPSIIMSTSNQALPTTEVLQTISKEVIYDKNGNQHALGELMAGKRTLLVFIRHFCMPSPGRMMTLMK
jgi:hypothetical protein